MAIFLYGVQMKKLFTLVVVALSFSALTAFALDDGDRQITGAFSYYLPSGDFYEAGAGFDAKFSWWQTDEKAYVLSVGYMQWGLAKNTQVGNINGNVVGLGLTGDVNMIPVGASVLWRNQTDYSRNVDVSLELGLKYVIADSDAEALQVSSAGTGSTPIDVENTALALVGMEIDYFLSDDHDLILGVGYNLDILKGDVNVAGATDYENELGGFYFTLGYGRRF